MLVVTNVEEEEESTQVQSSQRQHYAPTLTLMQVLLSENVQKVLFYPESLHVCDYIKAATSNYFHYQYILSIIIICSVK